MAAKYWIKLYHEILYDPKMGMMSDRLYRRTIELFLLAGEVDDEGTLPPLDEIAWKLRLDKEQLETEMIELQEVGILSRVEGRWYVTKFAERQSASTSTERSRYYRERTQKEKYQKRDAVCGIYLIECAENGKVYIGSSKDISRRIKAHFRDGKTFRNHWMYKDLQKYGRDAFRHEILEVVESEAKLPARETYWINQYNGEKYNTELVGKHHRDREATGVQRYVAQITDTDTDKIRIDTEEITDKSAAVAAVATAYQNNVGALTPMLADDIADMVDEYPLEWILYSIKTAVQSEKRNLRYIRGILRNIKRDGFNPNGKAMPSGELTAEEIDSWLQS